MDVERERGFRERGVGNMRVTGKYKVSEMEFEGIPTERDPAPRGSGN